MAVSMESSTLADIFLGFGGKTFYTVGTALTCSAVMFGVNRMTGLGIKVVSNLSKWLGVSEDKGKEEEGKEVLVTRKQVWDEVTLFGKISGILAIGVLIKFMGNFMGKESTIQAFNEMLYSKQ